VPKTPQLMVDCALVFYVYILCTMSAGRLDCISPDLLDQWGGGVYFIKYTIKRGLENL